MLALYDELEKATACAGFPQYRTSVACSDRILTHAPEFQSLANAIKSAIDPTHIIAPARYGVAVQ